MQVELYGMRRGDQARKGCIALEGIFNHAELCMSETRAVNRALRKAYGIALCSVEELPPWTAMGGPNEGIARVLESRSA